MASAFGGRRSIQLSYGCGWLEAVGCVPKNVNFDQIRQSDRGEILVSFFVRPFFHLPKPARIRYKIATLALDVSLRRAALYPAELRVRAGGG